MTAFSPSPVGLASPPDAALPPLRIYQIGKSWFSEAAGGGSNRVFDALQRHLGGSNSAVHGVAVGPDHGKRPGAHGVSLETASLWRRWRDVRSHVKATLTAFNPCVVTSHFALYTLPVLDVIRDRPFVVHFHGPWAQESALENEAAWKVALKSQLERTVYRRADRFVVLSEAFRDVLVNSFGVSPARIRIVPGGVDVDRFDVPGSVHDARTRLGLPSDRPIVVSVRRLVQRMGLETLIDAWADVRAQYPDVLLLLAGKGPLAPRLQARIDAHDLQHHVRLLGFVPDEDLPYLYRAADLSIIPTMGLEGFGLISVESLAAGTPVLATPVGGLPEVLGGLSNDLLLPGGTADVLSDAVVQALSGRLNLPSGSECAAFAREQYSWARIAELTRLVYRELA